jgi:hypothetical protein
MYNIKNDTFPFMRFQEKDCTLPTGSVETIVLRLKGQKQNGTFKDIT